MECSMLHPMHIMIIVGKPAARSALWKVAYLATNEFYNIRLSTIISEKDFSSEGETHLEHWHLKHAVDTCPFVQ